MIEDLIDVLGLALFGGLAYYGARRCSSAIEEADDMLRTLRNPKQYVNTAKSILDSYDKHDKRFNPLKLNKRRVHEFENEVIYEVLVIDRLYTDNPHYINFSNPTISSVDLILTLD